MLKRLFYAAIFMLAACQTPATTISTKTPVTPTPAPTTQSTAEATAETTANATADATAEVTASDSQWLETEMNGVSLGMWKPDGWETDLSEGLVLAEHTAMTNGMIEGGMLVYVFVPPVDEFDVSGDDSNVAWAVLDQVVKMPSHTGYDVAVSEPTGFDWDQYGAAYYLLSSGDGIKALVLAWGLSKNPPKVVVCNVSVPSSQASRIRMMLPTLIDGLTINGRSLSADMLGALPDPLPFPPYNSVSRSSENRVVAGSPP